MSRYVGETAAHKKLVGADWGVRDLRRRPTPAPPDVIIHWKVLAATEALTVGDGKDTMLISDDLNGYELVDCDAGVFTVSTSGLPTVQLRNITQAVDMLTTKITIDANEFSSYFATTPAAIDTANDDVATGDRVAVDVDAAGTGAKGLDVILRFRKPQP